MRRRKRNRQNYNNRDYYRSDYYSEEDGFWGPVKRFFAGLLIGVVVISLASLSVFLLVRYFADPAGFTAVTGQVFFYALIVGGIVLAFLVVYWIASFIAALSKKIGAARVVNARSKQEKIRMQKEELQLQRERERERVQPQQMEYAARTPFYTKQLPVREVQEQDENVEVVPQEVPGMPKLPAVYFRDYKHLVKPGELIIGVKKDKKARIGEWSDLKILLILGASASGKTTTMVEKCLGAVRGGGLLIVCDPHGHKNDSLLRRIYPLKNALFPGTTFAIEHQDILKNILIVKQELERRVKGADCNIPVFLIIEEMNRLQRDESLKKALTEILQIIGQEGRGFNVYCIIGAQQITHFPQIRKAIISFIVHRVDESESRLCIPARFAKYSLELKVGQTWVKDADGLTEGLVQVVVTVEDVQAEAQRLEKRTQAIQANQKPRPTVQLPDRSTTPLNQKQQRLILPPPPDDTYEQLIPEETLYSTATERIRTSLTTEELAPTTQDALQNMTAREKLDALAALRKQNRRTV